MKLNVNFNKQLKHLEHFITDNSPALLTAIGVFGVGATAFLTHKATRVADMKLQNEVEARNIGRDATDGYARIEDVTFSEKLALTWKLYLIPVASGTLTCVSIVGAQTINARRAAAIAGILALTQDDLKEYKAKVKEKMTGPTHKKMEGEIAQENVQKVLDRQGTIHIPDGRVQCVEAWTQRPFLSEYNALLQAENEINRKILKEDSASLSAFYDILGLDHTDSSDDFGWNTSCPLELDLIPVETSDHKPAYSVVYAEKPMYRPWQAGSFR